VRRWINRLLDWPKRKLALRRAGASREPITLQRQAEPIERCIEEAFQPLDHAEAFQQDGIDTHTDIGVSSLHFVQRRAGDQDALSGMCHRHAPATARVF